MLTDKPQILDVKFLQAVLCGKFFTLTLDLVTFNLIVFVILTLSAVEIEFHTDAGVVNIDVPAAADIASDVLNDAEKLGPGSLLPGPVLFRTLPIPLYSR